MYMEYLVDLGINIWKNGRKTHILGKIQGAVPVPNRAVQVSIVFCPLVLYFDHCSYYGHKLVIYAPI